MYLERKAGDLATLSSLFTVKKYIIEDYCEEWIDLKYFRIRGFILTMGLASLLSETRGA